MMEKFEVVDIELFESIQKDYQLRSFAYLKDKYRLNDKLLRMILGSQTYEDFCDRFESL